MFGDSVRGGGWRTLAVWLTTATIAALPAWFGAPSGAVRPAGAAPAAAPRADEPPPSHAFGIWSPGPGDTCSKAVHDAYSTVGPDGKRYPTWHPPVDPVTGCSFGHEHGRDPRGSNRYDVAAGLPFGVANEALAEYDPAGPRHEDHVGHKVEWANGVPLKRTDGTAVGVTCDYLVKLHQGTHSKDAFTNNLHELVYSVGCDDGTRLSATTLAAIGNPGEFVRGCDRATVVAVGPAVPASSPAGGGARLLPDRACVERYLLARPGTWSDYARGLYEDWTSANELRTGDGQRLAFFDPQFIVFNPSRYHDPAAPDGLARPLDACFEVAPNGNRASGGRCEDIRADAPDGPPTFDDPRSPFNGARRKLTLNQTTIDNADGPTVWYTDPFGGHAAATPFPGSIRQLVAAMDNTDWGSLAPQNVGADREYGDPTVLAPK